jgi:hypothetical protein
MRLGTIVRLLGDAGKHENKNNGECMGREFAPRIVGSGGAYTNVVTCNLCGRELNATETSLLGPAAYAG